MSVEIRKNIVGLRNAARELKPGINSEKIKQLQNKIVRHARQLEKSKGRIIKKPLLEIRHVLFIMAGARDFRLPANSFKQMKKKLLKALNAIALKLKITRHS